MEVRRDIVIETLTTLKAAADRLEVLEFHGQSAPIVTVSRRLERELIRACSVEDRLIAPSPERPDPQAPIVVTREALRTVLREELAAAVMRELRDVERAMELLPAWQQEVLRVLRHFKAEQATDGPSVESSSPMAQGAHDGSA